MPLTSFGRMSSTEKSTGINRPSVPIRSTQCVAPPGDDTNVSPLDTSFRAEGERWRIDRAETSNVTPELSSILTPENVRKRSDVRTGFLRSMSSSRMNAPPLLRRARRSKPERAVSRTTIAASVFVAALADTIATRSGSSRTRGVVTESTRYPIRLKWTTTVGATEVDGQPARVQV